MDCSLSGSSVHGDSPGKNTGEGCHSLLQGIFTTQGLNPRSPALQVDSLPSEPPGKPFTLLPLSFVGVDWEREGLFSNARRKALHTTLYQLCPWINSLSAHICSLSCCLHVLWLLVTDYNVMYYSYSSICLQCGRLLGLSFWNLHLRETLPWNIIILAIKNF